jgi:hypothetical protein
MHLLKRLWAAPRVWRYIAIGVAVIASTGVGVKAAGPSLATFQIGWATPTGETNVAHVDGNGNLQVGGMVNVGNLPATQPVSGTVNVGNLPATQQVSGTVNTLPGQPNGAFSVATFGRVLIGGQSAAVTYAITSVTFANPTSTSTTAVIIGDYGALTSDCHLVGGAESSSGPAAFVPAFSTVTLVFPQPFMIAPPTNPLGNQSCLEMSSNANVITSVVGYRT